MKPQKLKFHFHNPNTAEATADYILKILLEANGRKLEQVLREDAQDMEKAREA